MSEATLLLAEDVDHVPPHNVLFRDAGAVAVGAIAGAFLWAALQVGLRYHYTEEQQSAPWGIFFWGEHWALRVAASWAAAIGAGFVTGMLARQRGRTLAVIAALPSVLCWLGMAVSAWRGHFPFTGDDLDFHVSIGNKLAASLLALTILPFAAWGGKSGEEQGQTYGTHFDSRRFSVAGIKWYHYLWLPFPLYLWLIQASWTVFYGLSWLKTVWKFEEGLFSILPAALTMMIWGTIAIMVTGAGRAYAILAGFEPIPNGWGRAFGVFKYGVGSFLLAAILQIGITLIQFWLARFLGYSSGVGGSTHTP